MQAFAMCAESLGLVWYLANRLVEYTEQGRGF